VFTSRKYVDLDWNNATDNVGVTRYDVYVNNVKKYTSLTSDITIDSLVPNTAYTFSVKAADMIGNVSAFSNVITVTTGANGLKYTYYEGDWNVLPDFDTLTAIKSGAVANVDLSVRNVNDFFGIKWEGYINIKTAGTYTFELASDDGSKLYFNTFYSPTATALVNNSGHLYL
jgi:large repetitive protein